MHFENFLFYFSPNDFPAYDENIEPELNSVCAVKDALCEAFKSEEFKIDCIELELERLYQKKFNGGLEPFFKIPDLGINFSLGYWKPGQGVSPHEHNSWTVTGILENKLEVLTYHREQTYRQCTLIPKRKFLASQGDAGFVYDPCIHKPTNTSRYNSLSLHIYGPLDGQKNIELPEQLRFLDDEFKVNSVLKNHPFNALLDSSNRMKYIDMLVDALLLINSPKSRSIISKYVFNYPLKTQRKVLGLSHFESDTEKLNYQFERVHDSLDVFIEHQNDFVIVSTTSPYKTVIINKFMREYKDAIDFIITLHQFRLGDLPQNLRHHQKVVEELEFCGLFKRINYTNNHTLSGLYF